MDTRLLATENPNQMKIIAYGQGKMPISEGLPVITSPYQLARLRGGSDLRNASVE